jgi:hypothetical protein
VILADTTPIFAGVSGVCKEAADGGDLTAVGADDWLLPLGTTLDLQLGMALRHAVVQ